MTVTTITTITPVMLVTMVTITLYCYGRQGKECPDKRGPSWG